jgi:hypothetical protein
MPVLPRGWSVPLIHFPPCDMIHLTPPTYTPSPTPTTHYTCSYVEGNQEELFERVGYPEYIPTVFSSPSAKINEASMPDQHEKVR